RPAFGPTAGRAHHRRTGPAAVAAVDPGDELRPRRAPDGSGAVLDPPGATGAGRERVAGAAAEGLRADTGCLDRRFRRTGDVRRNSRIRPSTARRPTAVRTRRSSHR